QYKLIEEADAKALRETYCFLRDVEHRLQMENNLQTHTIPTDRAARLRLARLTGFSRLEQFERAHRQHTSKVRKLYSEFLPLEQSAPASALPQRFDGEENAWKKTLAEHGFKNIDQSLRLLKEFTQGPGYVH